VENITIAFHRTDAPLAYYIKKRIGHGKVANIKGKNALIYRANLKGSIVIAKLINGKLRTDKINNFICLLELINKRVDVPLILQEKDTSKLTNSYWLAGFCDACGSFQIKTLNIQERRQVVRLCFIVQMKNSLYNQQKSMIPAKQPTVLNQIFKVFGGSVFVKNGMLTYSSYSYGSAKKIINYFDHFNLLSSKRVNFFKWRKLYRLAQHKKYDSLVKYAQSPYNIQLQCRNVNSSINPFYSLDNQSKKTPGVSQFTVRLYSTFPVNLTNSTINPFFITGFIFFYIYKKSTQRVDGEGSFIISLIKKNNKLGCFAVNIQLRFQIGLHSKDTALLEQIKNYFGCGIIYKREQSDVIEYNVRSISDLTKIINHLDRYPLITHKLGDYLLFKQAFKILLAKKHLTSEGLLEIISIKASLNRGLPKELKLVFPDITPQDRPLVINLEIKDPNWLAGFTSAEGCYLITISASPNSKLKERVKLRFQLTQHTRDEQLIGSLINFLDCGRVLKNRDVFDFIVEKFSDLENKIVPFFKKYPSPSHGGAVQHVPSVLRRIFWGLKLRISKIFVKLFLWCLKRNT
jgi:hypothetical protein